MQLEQLEETLYCLHGERRVFHYFRDRYAFMLLERMARGQSVAQTRRAGLDHLLSKPMVATALRAHHGQPLDDSFFAHGWLGDVLNFVVTLSSWDCDDMSWSQSSRRGHNLVVQLNFCNSEVRRYKQLAKPHREAALNYTAHPVYTDGTRETLAWARVDFDLTTGEALIEEIQTDWVRFALQMLKTLRRIAAGEPERDWLQYSFGGSNEDLERYVTQILQPYIACWDEAMLAATIAFVHDDLGLRSIYYHSSESGSQVKRIRYGRKPPRSLYSKLPRRFGFRKVTHAPRFLADDKNFRRLHKRIGPVSFYHLDTTPVRSDA